MGIVLIGIIAALGTFWLYTLIRLRISIVTYKLYWQKRQQESGDVVYVVLGDSAAQGIGATHPRYSYPARIAEAIAEHTGQAVRVVNISVTGATTSDVIATQLPQLRALAPDLVTLAIGGNDIRRYDTALFTDNIDQIIRALPKGSFVADAPYFMHGQWNERAIQMRDVTQERSRHYGMHIVHLYDAMAQQGWGAMWNAYGADWFHPNNRGYDVWFKAFWRTIRSQIK